MFYECDHDPHRESKHGAIKEPPQARPESFVDAMHAGRVSTGYRSFIEARMHCRRGLVVLKAENGKHYVVSQWAHARYYRYINEAEQARIRLHDESSK